VHIILPLPTELTLQAVAEHVVMSVGNSDGLGICVKSFGLMLSTVISKLLLHTICTWMSYWESPVLISHL